MISISRFSSNLQWHLQLYYIYIYIYIYSRLGMIQIFITIMGSQVQIIQLGFGLQLRAWGFGRECEKSESKEEYLLGLAKHKSGIDPNDQSDLPISSNDRDMYHKRTRKMGTQKYLRENCYHSIECSVANSLAALMRK